MTARTASILLLATLLIATPAFGQPGYRHPFPDASPMTSSGAVVPNAQVKVVNTDTNFESLSSTNAEGLFRVPSSTLVRAA